MEFIRGSKGDKIMNDFGKALKEIIIEQREKIKELKNKNNILESLLGEYIMALRKREPSGLLIDAVGRKLLFDLMLEKENKK